jgi:protein tyrosine phosphatase (PTP) superfamily phosphohydrolase (DUF442 family)
MRGQLIPAVLMCALVVGCASRPATAHRIDGVDNFGVVSSDVWRGARPTAVGMQTLKQMGVKTVINLETHDEASDIPAGVAYVHLPTSPFLCNTVDADALLQAIAMNPKPIFIHCHEGRDRTGIAVAIYQCQVEKMSPADAIRELHDFHVHIWWAGLMEARIRALHPAPRVTVAASS